MKRVLEITAAEGGKDSQIFVGQLADAYERYCVLCGWNNHRLSTSSHKIKIEISGKDLSDLDNESGGHRIQRVPPTEKRGRVHTSTVTVSITDPTIQANNKYFQREKSDYRIEWFSGTGKGGQHRNKHQNSCRIFHTPTGLKQEKQGRERKSNEREAKAELNKRLDLLASKEKASLLSSIKKNQIGSGMRGDKFRTYRFQDDQVVDHRTGKKAKCAKVMKGRFDLLH